VRTDITLQSSFYALGEKDVTKFYLLIHYLPSFLLHKKGIVFIITLYFSRRKGDFTQVMAGGRETLVHHHR